MKSRRLELYVCLAGFILLGVAYYLFKRAVPIPVFPVGILGYLVALRVLARRLAQIHAAKAPPLMAPVSSGLPCESRE